MAHQQHLENTKYRQWAKAGLGLGYLKDGLAPFCQNVANQQHNDILDNIQRTKSLSPPLTCGSCQLESLRPDHVKTRNNICPLNQAKCNCLHPNDKNACPSNICGAIYDSIIKSHASRRPAPNWTNTNSQMWTADPWSIAKCFIYAPGYEQRTSAADTDCTGLLHVIINNKYFHNHISCNVSGPNIFSKVRQYRNEIFHSSSMELEEIEANSYIDDMIKVLQDDKELVNEPYAQQAVKKLEDLKNKDFHITTESFEDVLKQIKEYMVNVLKSTDSSKKEHKEIKEKLVNIEEALRKFQDEMAKSTEANKELLKQTKDEIAKSAEANKELLKQTKDEMAQSAEANKELLKQTKDEMAKSTEASKELLKQSKDEMAKCTEATNKLLKQVSTKEEYIGLKRRVSDMETHLSEQKEEKRRRKEDSLEQRTEEYEKAKAELREQMIERYREKLLQVPVLPLIPGDYKRNFNEIYIRPVITCETKGEKGESKEQRIQSMHEIFTKNEVPIKSIFVAGGAGSGKSSFCKYLVNCWCRAHSKESEVISETSRAGNKQGIEEKSVLPEVFSSNGYMNKELLENDIKGYENAFNSVKEMGKFEFLFYIALRSSRNVVSIHEMLKRHYKFKLLDEILERDSEKIIILLDGLDEWSSETITNNQFQTEGLPEQDYFKNYTILTTSRPWKIHTLGVIESYGQQLLKLQGFDERCEKIMIYRTVSYLNTKRGDNKDINNCVIKLSERSVRCLKQAPIMLQQLICLWFDGKLDQSSRCAVYTGMLELFIIWNANKYTGKNVSSTRKVDLPQYLAVKRACKSYSHLIYDMSRLAYETLFKCPKEKSLTFEISVFDDLEISDDVRESCLKLGILTEETCPSLSVSEPPSSIFSFIHKSVQEFLAAVNIAINFIRKKQSSNSSGKEDLEKVGMQFVKEIFQNCSTVNDILEQSNVIIMLCGLEPKLATPVSKYVYDIANGDSMVQRYRRTIDKNDYADNRRIRDIQNIIFDSMKECNACLKENFPTLDLGDLMINNNLTYGIVCSNINQQLLTPDSVRSIDLQNIDIKTAERIPQFRHLEKICISTKGGRIQSFTEFNEQVSYEEIVQIVRLNASSLKSLSLGSIGLFDNNTEIFISVLPVLPCMTNLVAIKITCVWTSHEDTTRFCKYLEGTIHLEQIHIDMDCECNEQHCLDLSKHQQLQYLCINIDTFVTVIGSSNLEELECIRIRDTENMKMFDSIGTCKRLKKLSLVVYILGMSQSSYISLTKRLVSMLPLLHNLRNLELRMLILTDNIIQAPSEMKSLKCIILDYVKMSLTTWKKFVDSLPSIPHTVDVWLGGCFITEDNEEFNEDSQELSFEMSEKKLKDGIQYVKDQKQLFHVISENSFRFRFSTTK